MPVYLRAEAVNLSWVVFDTEDLSTIRGGGLLILDLEQSLRAALNNHGLSCSAVITKGASQIVVRIDDNLSVPMNQIPELVEKEFRSHPQLKVATILTAICDRPWAEARAHLLATIRRRQLESASLSLTSLAAASTATSPNTNRRNWCEIDLVRPAQSTDRIADETYHVSSSVAIRRKFGKTAKQTFLAREKDVAWKPTDSTRTFAAARHFHQIASFDRAPGFDLLRAEHSNLDGKMAIFYADGNGFGKKQIEHCQSEEAQRAFTEMVFERQAKALRAMLDRAWSDSLGIVDRRWWQVEEQTWHHRFETLMWGGDEVMFAVPAWFGLSVACDFFRTVESINEDRKGASKVESLLPLTYSAGLVFCNVKTPIQQIVKLAKSRADAAKSWGGEDTQKFAYAVLESLDEWSAPKEVEPIAWSQLPQLIEAVTWMTRYFPRGSVYRIIDRLRDPSPDDQFKEFTRWFERACQDIPLTARNQTTHDDPTMTILDRFDLRKFSSTRPQSSIVADWYHLAELWDYVVADDTTIESEG